MISDLLLGAFAEKFRALAERTRPRDLYDVVNLYRNTESRPDAAAFRSVLQQKCEFKGIELPQLADLMAHRSDVEAGWKTMLDHQLPALLPVDAFWDELPAIFNWLHGVAVEAPLAAFPITGTIVRERVLTTSGGFSNQSFIETIRFAAANRLRIDLQYRDLQGAVTTRTVEPYSIGRRVSTGPSYIFRCPVCGKQFSRKKHDAALGAHKNKSGRECYGRYGTYVRIKY